ncbi:MAG: VOC family protein, partial [Lentisphaerae bacterium]|nr:VOC family protein [Lentisphaerota bacterium]
GEEMFERSVEFYRDVLRMSEVRSWKNGTMKGVMLDFGSGIVEITSNGTDSPGQGAIRHMAFATDDVDACVEAVRNAGYKITMEPGDMVIPSEVPMNIRIAFCIGPAGEELEFFQEK